MNQRKAEKIRNSYNDKIKVHIDQIKAEGFGKVVVVNGFPKSGNTWLCRLLSSYWRCSVEGYLGNPSAHEIASEGNINRNMDVCILKSHHMPSHFQALDKDFVKVLHIVRDPRDVSLSAAAYFNGNNFYKKGFRIISLINIVRKIMRNSPDNPTWWSAGWGGYHRQIIVNGGYYLRYESLLENDKERLEQFIKIVDGKLDPVQLQEAFDSNSFKNTKKKLTDSVNRIHLRSGRIGEHKKFLPPVLGRLIVSRIGPVMKFFNY